MKVQFPLMSLPELFSEDVLKTQVPLTIPPFFDVVANVADPLTVRMQFSVNDPVIVRLATSTAYPD